MIDQKLIIKDLLKARIETPDDLASFKRKIAKKYKIGFLSNIQILKAYHSFTEKSRFKISGAKKKKIENLLRTRPIRSLSGIVNISVLTKPYACPGQCVYCPSEKGAPKSYLAGEPAVERAKALKYNPYIQVSKRIEMLEQEGHPTDKIELRIIGGSWSSYSKNYRKNFIEECFRACNNFANSKSEIRNPKFRFRETKSGQIRSTKSQALEKKQKKNEKAKHRIVGISIETRPDLINKKEIINLRELGVTLVEIGVQTIFDDILKKCKRGHGVKETIKATSLLKDSGFKVMYQMMPNLPGSDKKRDLECFNKLFSNSNFKPDWLKIYPCIVCQGSDLYEIWKRKKYKPYSKKTLIKLLADIKKGLPCFVRVARLFRDIPSQKIEAGCKTSNLRGLILEELKKENKKCNCIRCREVQKNYNPKEKIYLFREDYEASKGKEIFLSFETENRKKLFSFLRLRIPSQYFKKEKHFLASLQDAALIREIHTYGQLISFNSKTKTAPQHKGLGKKLVREAEKITSKELKIKKIAVISGIGARGYWRSLNYKISKNGYMVKKM